MVFTQTVTVLSLINNRMNSRSAKFLADMLQKNKVTLFVLPLSIYQRLLRLKRQLLNCLLRIIASLIKEQNILLSPYKIIKSVFLCMRAFDFSLDNITNLDIAIAQSAIQRYRAKWSTTFCKRFTK